jgi:hypothetical protein
MEQLDEQFVVQETQVAMQADAQNTSHPLINRDGTKTLVNSPTEVERVFDILVSSKGQFIF